MQTLNHKFLVSPNIAFTLEHREHPTNLQPERIDQDEVVVLGRFTFLRRHSDRLAMESAISNIIVGAESPAAMEMFARLAAGCSAASLAGKISDQSLAAVSEFLGILLAERLIRRVHDPEPADLAMWEFHDLLFHRVTRVTDMNREFATFRFRENLQPLPPFKPAMSSHAISLQKPDLDKLAQSEPPFTKVLESRRSKRIAGRTPITLKQLAEFLYRTAHVQQIRPDDEMQRMCRPYASGGGVHELEFYLVVNRCSRLETGVYHYSVDEHRLYQLQESAKSAQRVSERCAVAAAIQPRLPDVVVVMTARFPRLFFKYETIGYRLILMHVGVVMQTMYLIATAMSLSPCAIGSGWLRFLEQEDELAWLKEGAVGEFMLSGQSDQ